VQRRLQAKLTVAQPDDGYEKEADRVAEQVTAMPEPHVQRQSLGEEEEELQVKPVADQITPLVQRQADEGDAEPMPVPKFRLPTPSLLEPGEAGEQDPQLDPGLYAALRLIERQLNPASVRSALLQIDPGTLTLPPPALAGTASGESTETAEAPAVPAGAGPETPREASGSDVMRAFLAVPAVDSLIGKVGTLVLDKVGRDLGRLSAGEAGLVGITTGVIGVQALGQVLSRPEARQKALELLSGRTFPVPGIDGLQFEMSSRGEEWTVGLHLDVGAFLPPELGFGPSSPSAFGPPSAPKGASSSTVQRQEADPEERERESPESKWAVDADLEGRIAAVRGGGRPLPEFERGFFEPRFGYDFGEVRIHTGAEAVETAEELDAQAYTVGQDIVFGQGRYAPETEEGRQLLAHELTHVVQQHGATRVTRQAPEGRRGETNPWFDDETAGQRSGSPRQGTAVTSGEAVEAKGEGRTTETITLEWMGQRATVRSREQLAIYLKLAFHEVKGMVSDLKRRDPYYFADLYTRAQELVWSISLRVLALGLAESSREAGAIGSSVMKDWHGLVQDVRAAEARQRRGQAQQVAARIERERRKWECRKTALLVQMHRAFRAKNEDLIGKVSDAYAKIGGLIGDAASAYGLIREWNGQTPLSIAAYKGFLDKAMSVVGYLSGLGDEVPGLASLTEEALGKMQRAYNTVSTLTSLLDLSPGPHSVFISYIGPALAAVSKAWSRISDHIRKQNDFYYEAHGKETVNWYEEPGGPQLANYMERVFAAAGPTDVPAVPEDVNKFFLHHRELLDAVMSRAEFGEKMPTERRWLFWRRLKPTEFKAWVFANRRILWRLIYGMRRSFPSGD
jgi:hypothetical protein